MPHQLGVTIRAQVAADQVGPLRNWLAKVAQNGAADSLFAFGHMRGLHFAKLFVLEEPTDSGGRPIPASLVLMTEVDAPLRSHLAELIDVGGDGIDEAFGFCAGYPGPAAQRRARVAWLRRHLVGASAVYVNTVGRGLEQIRQEARLRDALEDYLDQGDWDGRAPDDVRRELQAYVAGRADLAWAMKPPAPPSLRFRVREAAHEVGVPLLLVPLLPALPFVLPAVGRPAAPVRTAGTAGYPAADARAPGRTGQLRGLRDPEPLCGRRLRPAGPAAAGDHARGDGRHRLRGPARVQPRRPGRDQDHPLRPLGSPGRLAADDVRQQLRRRGRGLQRRFHRPGSGGA